MDKHVQVITEADLRRYDELNKQKKEIDQEMNELKRVFHLHLDDKFGDMNKGEIQIGNYKVQRQIRISVKYKEEKTIKKLEELNLSEFIEVVKRPNTEKLVAAIKLGLVSEKEFLNCRMEKSTPSILVKETFSQ